jgi:Reverse transcriptase (RNA-dependent DNA polymerase)
MWMAREFPHIPFERYADDAICHCHSAEEARALWSALGERLAACKLVLHPVKTKIVYCKDVRRRGDFPVISFDFLGFQFRARKTMWRKGEMRIFTHRFQPAASPKALTRISREQPMQSPALLSKLESGRQPLAQSRDVKSTSLGVHSKSGFKTVLLARNQTGADNQAVVRNVSSVRRTGEGDDHVI